MACHLDLQTTIELDPNSLCRAHLQTVGKVVETDTLQSW